jgi:hypothetical protein
MHATCDPQEWLKLKEGADFKVGCSQALGVMHLAPWLGGDIKTVLMCWR